MPTCSRCKVAYLDGESHRCPPKSHPALIVCGCLLVIYAGSALMMGSAVMPALFVGYFGYNFAHALAAGVGHLVVNMLHAFGR